MNDERPPGPPEELRSALDDGIDELRAAELSGPSRAVAWAVLAALRERDSEKVLTSIETLRRDIGRIDTVLAAVLARGLREQREEARARPFQAAWLSQLRRRLRQEDEPERRRTRWLAAWAEALSASAWDACTAVADMADMADGRHDDELVADLRWVSERLREDVPVATLPVLRRLLDTGRLPPEATVSLLVLASRATRRSGGRLDEAEAWAARAVTAVPQSPGPARSLALAALAETHLAAGRRRAAEDLLDRALETEVGTVDLIVAVGRLATSQGQHSRANDYYEVTAQRFGRDAVRGDLLREVPGNLFWQTARRVRLTDPGAGLDLYERARQAGIAGAGDHPDRRAIVEQAEVLEQLGRREEAAACYRQAADRYSWAESAAAVRLYQAARRLDPDSAVHHWLYGEALRASVSTADPGSSERVLLESKEALREGFRIAAPDRQTAWALVSAAIVSSRLDDGEDVFLMVERALLLDPGSTRAMAFLLLLLRDRGFPREAAQVADPATAVDNGDDVLTAWLALAEADLGRYADAVATVEGHLAAWGATDDLRLLLAVLHLRQDDPGRALSALDDEPALVGVPASVVRGLCHALSGRADEERTSLRSVLGDPEANRSSTAWAEFRLGDLDRSIELYRDLVATTPVVSRQADDQLDLGLVLLVRGAGDDDLAGGRDHLLAAVERTNHADELVHALTCDVPLVRRSVRGACHEAEVDRILTELTARAEARIAELRERTRPASDTAVLLAAARSAMAGDRVVDALDRYTDILAAGGPEETAAGVLAAAQRALEEGDRLLAEGAADPAREWWERAGAAARLDRLPAGDAGRLLSRVAARLVLWHLQQDPAQLAEARGALAGTDPETVRETFLVVAADLPSAWRASDLLRQAVTPAGSGDRSSHLPDLPPAVLYRTRQDDVPDVTLQPFTGAVGVAVGTGCPGLRLPELQRGITALREDLDREVGVRVPGVRTYLDGELPAGTVHFLVYDQRVGGVVVPAADPDPAAAVLRALDVVVRDNMFRWVTVDDVDLWADGWELTAQEPEDGEAPAESPQRYRLAQLLRALLQEGVPIRDRPAILQGFREAEDRGLTDLVDQLGIVRPRLYPDTCGPVAPAPPTEVPRPLQDRMAARLSTDGVPAWRAPRSEVAVLLRDIREWRGTLPPGPIAVRVREPRVRLALWRLLAAERPRVHVLADGELR